MSLIRTENKVYGVVCAVMCLIAFIACLPEKLISNIDTANLRAYWAATSLFQAGKNPYDQSSLASFLLEQLGVEVYVEYIWHLPAIFVIPFRFFAGSYSHFIRIEIAFTLSIYLVCCYLLTRKYVRAENSNSAVEKLFFILLSCYSPFIQSIPLSPTASLSLLCFLIFLFFESNQKRVVKFSAGFILSYTFIKFTPLLILYIHLLFSSFVKKDFFSLGGFLSGILLLFLLPVLFNPEIYSYYLALFNTPPVDWKNPNISTWVQIICNIINSKIKFIVFIIGVVLYFISQLNRLKRKRGLSTFEDILPFSLLFSPYVWGYDYIYMLPYICAVIFTASLARQRAFLISTLIMINIVPLVFDVTLYSHYFIWYPIALLMLAGASRHKFFENAVGN